MGGAHRSAGPPRRDAGPARSPRQDSPRGPASQVGTPFGRAPARSTALACSRYDAPMRRKLLLLGTAVLLGFLVLVPLEAGRHDPVAAARAKAGELGVDVETCSITGGSYGNRLLSSYGAVELIEDAGRGAHVTVEVTRWPFGSWHLASFVRSPREQPDPRIAVPAER